MPAGDILTSHVSINFDRAGFQRDLNVIYPIDRLRELAAEGVIGGVAETHFTVMGSTPRVRRRQRIRSPDNCDKSGSIQSYLALSDPSARAPCAR